MMRADVTECTKRVLKLAELAWGSRPANATSISAEMNVPLPELRAEEAASIRWRMQKQVDHARPSYSTVLLGYQVLSGYLEESCQERAQSRRLETLSRLHAIVACMPVWDQTVTFTKSVLLLDRFCAALGEAREPMQDVQQDVVLVTVLWMSLKSSNIQEISAVIRYYGPPSGMPQHTTLLGSLERFALLVWRGGQCRITSQAVRACEIRVLGASGPCGVRVAETTLTVVCILSAAFRHHDPALVHTASALAVLALLDGTAHYRWPTGTVALAALCAARSTLNTLAAAVAGGA